MMRATLLRSLSVTAMAAALAACGSPGADRDAAADDTADWQGRAVPAVGDTAFSDAPGTVPAAEPGAASDAAPTAPAAPTPGQAPPTRQQPPPAAPGTAVQTLTGLLAVTGAQPMTFVTLQPEDGRAVQLLGQYESELRRLAGAVIRVEGTSATGRMPGPALTVRRYELVSVDGQRPYVGVLEAAGGEYRLAGVQSMRLLGVPPELAGRAGATIWVVGAREGDAVRLQSYGIIRP
jgi:hypothetical protein